jgi:hypothetical protein
MEAVERLWAETLTFAPYRAISMMVGAMDIILKGAAGTGRDAEKMREFAGMMLNSAGLGSIKPMSYAPDKERPFLDPICWALFSVYRQSSMYPAMLFHLAKIGVNEDALEKSSPAILQALKVALPEQVGYIEQQGLGHCIISSSR